MIGAAILLLAASVSASASADEPDINCDDAMNQMELNYCSYRDYQQADRELNAQWKLTAKVLKGYDSAGYAPEDGRPGYFETLLAAQRAWLTYRDTHCRSEGYAMRGGSGEPLVTNGCLATITRTRTAQLKDLAEEN